jgi:hypothetical protein
MKLSPSAQTDAGSSRRNARGEAAWTPPTATPYSAGARIDAAEAITREGLSDMPFILRPVGRSKKAGDHEKP